MTRRLALAAACALLAWAPLAGAQGSGWAQDLADELMSPFCPGRTLSACPSPQARTLIVWLGVQEAEGRSREDVKAELVERFGGEILPAPPPSGFGLTAYLFPVVAFAAGGVLLFVFLRRQTREATRLPAPRADAPLDPELAAIVDRDLAR